MSLLTLIKSLFQTNLTFSYLRYSYLITSNISKSIKRIKHLNLEENYNKNNVNYVLKEENMIVFDHINKGELSQLTKSINNMSDEILKNWIIKEILFNIGIFEELILRIKELNKLIKKYDEKYPSDFIIFIKLENEMDSLFFEFFQKPTFNETFDKLTLIKEKSKNFIKHQSLITLIEIKYIRILIQLFKFQNDLYLVQSLLMKLFNNKYFSSLNKNSEKLYDNMLNLIKKNVLTSGLLSFGTLKNSLYGKIFLKKNEKLFSDQINGYDLNMFYLFYKMNPELTDKISIENNYDQLKKIYNYDDYYINSIQFSKKNFDDFTILYNMKIEKLRKINDSFLKFNITIPLFFFYLNYISKLNKNLLIENSIQNNLDFVLETINSLENDLISNIFFQNKKLNKIKLFNSLNFEQYIINYLENFESKMVLNNYFLNIYLSLFSENKKLSYLCIISSLKSLENKLFLIQKLVEEELCILNSGNNIMNDLIIIGHKLNSSHLLLEYENFDHYRENYNLKVKEYFKNNTIFNQSALKTNLIFKISKNN